MRENVGRMFSNKQQMFDIESKSGGLKDTASRFKVQTQKLEKMARLKQMQVKVIIALISLAMLIVLYYLIF